MSEYIIKFVGTRLGYGNVELHAHEGNGIPKGVTAVYGKNGSGKSTLGLILEKGRHAFGNRLEFIPDSLKVKLIAFSDIHSLSGMEVTYLNQRMEATMNEYVPTVEEVMKKRYKAEGWIEKCSEVGLNDIKDKKINYLSSGELRKLLIVNALLDQPDLLILDNPYIGLDAQARNEFNASLSQLAQDGLSAVLLLSDVEDIPSFTNHVMEINQKTIGSPINFSEYIIQITRHKEVTTGSSNEIANLIPPQKKKSLNSFYTAFELKNGKLKYGDKIIFQNLDWKVKYGECWRLSGKNGSGKSLLLSMICADNPQAYSNDITIFDRKRGSGESIFEIKDNIGYVSPEMQLYFKSNDSIVEIVVQGLRNSLSRYQRSTPGEREEAMSWLRLLEIDDLAQRRFDQLSNGQQRLVMVARALIKQPPLLVLDEPFHGLDRKSKERLKRIINVLMERNHGTLIFVTHYDEETPLCVTKTLSL